MKTKLRSMFIVLALLASFVQTVQATVTFSVTPAAVSNTYSGTITLKIGGLTNTETVVVQKFLDLNTNGVIDGNDWLVQQFTLTDGQTGMVIGGVTNVNVPGDTDGTANGQITAPLNFQNGDIVQNIVGKYLYKLSSSVGHFAPITNQFVVTNFPYAQKFTGNVVSNGTSATVSNAVIILFPGQAGNSSPVGGAVANNSGNYTLPIPPGTYSLISFRSNYVANMSTAPVLTLAANQTIITNLTVIHDTNSISGKLVDSSNSSIGLAGVLMEAQASDFIGIAFTDTNGNFNLSVNAGTWELNANEKSLLVLGYVGLNNGTNVNAGATNVTLAVPKDTALFYGRVTNNLGNPLPCLEVYTDDNNDLYETESFTDTNGNYVLGVVGGASDSWWVVANGDNENHLNYVFTPDHHAGNVSINAAQVVLRNFTALPATNEISGWLRDNYGNPIAGVEIYASTTIGGLAYDQEMDTDSNGNYWLNVCNGNWDVEVATWEEDDMLPTNYICPADQYSVITNNNAVVNFTATNLPLQVTTTALPNGTNGVAYSQQLSAAYGKLPYSWTNSSGVLPSGLTLATNGVISGTPTNSGTFNFTVKVADALFTNATQYLTIMVGSPPSVALQPTNSSVVVTTGNNVTLAVSVTGTGPFTYQWQLNGTNLPNGIITTVAGNRTASYNGDGIAATNAELYNPLGVAVDTSGDLFISDYRNYRIRKIGTNGIITTVAGNGTNAYFGDGGAATNAELSWPCDMGVDASGNLFIADSGNNVIRKVGTNGIIITVAGNGTGNYFGDGGAATNAELSFPRGVAVDASGNLFIADSYNNVIRKVGTNGIITTVAGNAYEAGTGYGGYSGDGGAATNAELYYPCRVAVDAFGNMFIADSGNNVIRKVGTNGIIITVAGKGMGRYFGDGGAATNAELHLPEGVAVDAAGNLYIADTENQRIREVGTNGIITTVAGNGIYGYSGDRGAATNAELYNPLGVAVDATGNLFIADTYNNVIRKVVIFGPTLVLKNMGFCNAGAYDVVVSSPYGSVTSSVVNVTVTLPPVILSTPKITVGKTNFTFLLSGPAGSNYVLQVSSNLLNWSPVSTSTIPVSGTINLTNAITNYNRRFYRAVIP